MLEACIFCAMCEADTKEKSETLFKRLNIAELKYFRTDIFVALNLKHRLTSAVYLRNENRKEMLAEYF